MTQITTIVRITIATLSMLSALVFMGCAIGPAPGVLQPTLQRFEYARIIMGSKARVVVYADSEPSAAAAATRAFERVEQLDAVMSDYRADSELSRLTGHPIHEWIPVSDDLYRVLDRARRVSSQTHGAFDVTVGPLVMLWREARATGEPPSPATISKALDRTGWGAIELDEAKRRVRFTRPNIRLDLGGIGKGYAADAAHRSLENSGHPRSLVDLGGDLALGGPPPGARGWSIRVSNSIDQSRVLKLSNTCVATSGDAERFAVIGGERFSHIIDPRTGHALTRRRSATVIHPDGASADALASAACVLGPQGLQGLRRTYSDAVFFLAAPDDAQTGD